MKIRGVCIVVECEACLGAGEAASKQQYANLILMEVCNVCHGRGATMCNIPLKELAEALKAST
jgi:DnaJ-class molecular chaperone